MNIPNVLTKAAGTVGLGLILYDSHVAGKYEAASHSKNVTAGQLADGFEMTETLDSPSIVKSKLKNEVFKFHLDENISEFFTKTAGYASGIGSMMMHHVIPLGLSLGTVLTKGNTSRVFGAGLLAYGGIFFIQNVLGFGKHGGEE